MVVDRKTNSIGISRAVSTRLPSMSISKVYIRISSIESRLSIIASRGSLGGCVWTKPCSQSLEVHHLLPMLDCRITLKARQRMPVPGLNLLAAYSCTFSDTCIHIKAARRHQRTDRMHLPVIDEAGYVAIVCGIDVDP